ncbi:hypothetical protein JW926_17510 [Candidatus Sumerlaeota bacterium]|nr:hypothetical protein [Candidatus Sumerlaeota bacterium]
MLPELEEEIQLEISHLRQLLNHFSFDLQWLKMADLAFQCEMVLNLVEKELIEFLKN